MPYTVTRWTLGGYTLVRNPDRTGGDSGWRRTGKSIPVPLIGANRDNLQFDGIGSPVRELKFTGISGTMMRTLENKWAAQAVIAGTDHRYPNTPGFNCVITSFNASWRPSLWDEDMYDLQMTLMQIDKLS